MTKIFVISGLSGAGKDSVIDGLKEAGMNYTWVITTTTRLMRSNETQGNPYHFVSKDEFEKMVSNNEFFEWAQVYSDYYGNTKKAVEQALLENKPVILRIDAQGAATIKKKRPEAKVIFLIADSIEIIKQRLEKRGEDSLKEIKIRLAEIKKEMKTLDQWDYVIINKQGQLKETINQVKQIIEKEFIYN